QILLLLFRGAKELERCGYADGLRRREQRGEVPVLAGDQPDRVRVTRLAQAQAAILLRNLDPERAQIPEPLEHGGRDLSLAIDLIAVDLLPQEAIEPLDEW